MEARVRRIAQPTDGNRRIADPSFEAKVWIKEACATKRRKICNPLGQVKDEKAVPIRPRTDES